MYRNRRIKSTGVCLTALGLADFAQANTCSTDGAYGLKLVLVNLYCSFDPISIMLGGAGYLGGIAFGAAAALKFKQHRDNPAQVSVGFPLVYLTIAVGLVYMPSLLSEGRNTLFSDTGEESSAYIGVDEGKIDNNPWVSVAPS
jgi:intracellular multiplication protein IcmD